MPMEDFRALKWLPMPRLNDSSDKKWKSFEELYSNDAPSDVHCPSTTPNMSKSSQNPVYPFEPASARVRSVVFCAECDKGRLLFAAQILDQEQRSSIELNKEQRSYTCGGPFFPDDHDLSSTIIVKTNFTCSKPVSLLYYSKRSRLADAGWKEMCFHCAGTPVVNEPEKAAEHSGWASRCQDCKQRNLSSSRKRRQSGQH